MACGPWHETLPPGSRVVLLRMDAAVVIRLLDFIIVLVWFFISEPNRLVDPKSNATLNNDRSIPVETIRFTGKNVRLSRTVPSDPRGMEPLIPIEKVVNIGNHPVSKGSTLISSNRCHSF
jgi:hypothetical protein